jgi:hypothetical protein
VAQVLQHAADILFASMRRWLLIFLLALLAAPAQLGRGIGVLPA